MKKKFTHQNIFKILTFFILIIFSNTIYSQWSQVADLPQYKTRIAGFSIGTKGYALGGTVETASTYTGATPSKNLWIYDSSTNTWSAGPDYPGAANTWAFSFVINNIAYVGIGNETNFYAYDPITNTWTEKASRPSPSGNDFYNSTGFVLNNEGYALGSGSVLIKYDPSTNTWTSIDVSSTLPVRTGAFSFVANGKAYIGGGNNGGTYYNTFYEFDPSTNTFIQKANHPDGYLLYGVGYSIGGYGVVASGYSGYTNHHKYDPNTNTWTAQTSITSGWGTQKAGGFSLGNNIYVVGGTTGSLAINRTIKYAYATTSTITKTGSLTAFSTCTGTASAEQSFTVSGTDLTNDITVSAPTGYEVSLTSGSGFANSLSITQSGGTVGSTTVYVRLKSDASNAASGNISIASTGATTQNVATGTAIVSPTSEAGNITGTTTICSGNTTTLTLANNVGTIQWQSSADNLAWNNISGATSANYTTPALTANTYYRAVVTSGTCPSATTSAITVTVSTAPSAGTLSGTQTVCVGGTTTFSSTVSGGTWSSSDTSIATVDSNGVVTGVCGAITASNLNNPTNVANAGAGDRVGQSFTATTSGNLSAIKLTLWPNGSPQLVLREYNGSVLASAFDGAIIATSNAATNMPSIANWQDMSTFVFPTAPALVAGQQYTIEIINRTSSAYTRLQDVYAGGESFHTLNAGMVGDMKFQVELCPQTQQTATITYTVAGTGGCANAVATRAVTVDPPSVAGTISGAATVCSGTNSTTLTLSGYTGTIQWQSSTNGSTYTNISGATSATFTATNLTTTTYYKAVLTSGVCAAATTSAVTVTVNPLPVIAAKTATICSGSTFTVTPTNGTDVVPSGTLYTWTFTDNANVTGEANNLGSVFIGESTTRDPFSSYSFGDLSGMGGGIRDVGQSFTATQTNTLSSISVYFPSIITSGTATLNVYAGGGISGSLLSTQVVSINTVGENTFTLATPISTISGQVYTFVFNTIGGMEASINVSSNAYNDGTVYLYDSGVESNEPADLYFKTNYGTAPASSVTGTLTNTSTSNQDVVYSVTPVSGDGCIGTAFNVTVTVEPTSVAGTISGAATVCSGSTTTLTLANSVGTIQWQSSTDNATWTDINGEMAATLLTPAISAVSYFRAVVTSGSCTAATSTAFTVTPIALPAATIYGVDSFCEGTSVVLSADASLADIDYTAASAVVTEASSGWQSFTSGVNGNLSKVSFGFNNSSNTVSFIATLNIYSGEGNSGTLLGTQFVKINQPTSGFVTQDFILNSPIALTAGSVYTAELVAVSSSDKISFLNSDSSVNLAGGTSNVDSNTDYYFTNEYIPSAASGISFQWQVDTGSGFANVATNGTNQFINPTTAGDYKVTVTNTTTNCSNTSDAKTITLDLKPVVDAGADEKICGTTSVTFKLDGASVANGSTIYWYSSGTGTFDDQTIEKPTYTPSAADKDAGTVNLTVIVAGSGSCAAEVGYDSMTLTFAPAPTADAGVDTSFCSNASFTTAAIATNGTPSWTTSGDGSFNDNTILNPVYTPGSTDISTGSVTLTLTVAGTEDGCTSSTVSDTVVLTIIPAATADAGAAQVNVCTGLDFTASDAVATNGTAILWATAGSGSFDDATLEKPTYTPSAGDLANGSVLLTMTVTGNSSCDAVSEIRLIFTPVPTASAGDDAAICSNGSYTTVGIATGGTILWTSTGDGSFDDATALNAVYTPGNTDAANSPITLKLTVTGTNECASLSAEDEMQLTVSPANTADAGADTTICSNTTFQTQGQASNGTILWTTSGSGTFNDNTIAAPIYTPSANDKSAATVTLTMKVTALAGTACEGNIETDDVVLTITPEPLANAGPATAIICGGYTYQTQGSASNGIISWTTSGTGTFNDASIAAPIYTPGVNETSGTVTLTMTVTGQNGCASDTPSDSVVLSIFTTTAVVTTIDVSCNGGNNGFASIAASGGTAPYSYAWYKGATFLAPTGNELPNIGAGDYSCIVTDVNGCTVTKTFSITEPTAITITSTQTNVTTNNGSDGSASVTVTGGTAPYVYSWSPVGGTTDTATNLAAGVYTCTVVDAKGCSVSKQITIAEPSTFVVSGSSTNISCNGASDGTASVTATGGISPYTYLWSTGATTSSISGLAPATYTCTVTENNGSGLAVVKSFTITQPAVLTATALQTNITINGQSTGSASVTVSGGTSPYTYAWTNSSSTTSTASNLAAGTYSCTITDSKGCTISKDFTITQPDAFTLDSGSTTSINILCYGEATGSATVAVTGGVNPYTYSWSPNVSTGATASNLVAGTYVCTITDANGAKVMKSFTITQPNAVLSAIATSSNILCYGGTTTASVSVSGGSPGYTYSWSPSGGNASTATLTAGSYICTITDANGCTVTKNFLITQPASALDATTTQTDVLVYGSSTGSATVSVTGGTSPYTYSWAPWGGTAATASNLIAGTYTCTITDANGCTLDKVFVITQASAMIASGSSTNVNCYAGTDGTASITSVSGGSGSYTYLWSPSGGTSAAASGLTAGTYTCYITDSNGAFISKTFNISQPSTALSASISKVNPLINGASSGSATITVAGGTTPYSYLWSNGATTATATALTAGTYSCMVTDANGCTIAKTVELTQPSPLMATTAKTDVSCYGGNNGTAAVSVSGGVAPYAYVWNPSVGIGATLNGLTAGTYICTVTDANGAIIQKTIEVLQPDTLVTSVSQINVGCNGANSGSASITATGGTAPYTYSWYPSGGITSTASNLSAGNYSCIVTDSHGCSVTRNITITQASLLSATTLKIDVKCNGDSTGSATVSVTGGNPTYNYLWSNGATTATAANLVAGNYSCTITDANGCSLIESFTINQPAVLSATTSQTNVVCYGQATGSATVSVTGGVSPYNYLWSPVGGNTNTANNLTAGTYTCTITDTNNCVLVKTFTITESALIPTPTADAGPANASICAGSTYLTGGIATGGTILWTSNGSGTFDNPTIANATYTPSSADKATGNVTLTMKVTPPGSCGTAVATDNVVVTIYPVSAGGIINGATTVCSGTNSTTLKLSEYTGVIQWQYSTDNINFVNISGANSEAYVASNLTSTTYYKAIVTSGVCSSSESSVATINVTPVSVAGVVSGGTSVCYGTNSTTLSVSGYVGTIQWQSSSDNVTFNPIAGATSVNYIAENLTATKYYRVAVTNNVCSVAYSSSAAVEVNPLPVADAGPATTIICGGSSFTAAATALNGVATWSVVTGTGSFVNPNVTNAVYNPSAADISNGSVTLKLTVTGSLAGCSANSASDTIVVTINSPAAPMADAVQNICYVGTPKVLDLKTIVGSSIKWYTAAIGGSSLDPNTDLVSGNTYYATQTVAGCESISRTAVLVNLTCAVTAVKDILGPINGYTGGTTTSVLANDLLNGTFVIPAEVNLSAVTVPASFTFNTDGTVTIPAGTPSAVYKITYQICEVANPSNCSQVESDIVVGTTSIVAVKDEYGPINGVVGATTLSVLNNDFLNGVIVSPSEINLSTLVNTTVLVLNADGTITIPAGTSAGIYEFKYEIAEKMNPANVSQANIVVFVGDCLDFVENDCDGDGVSNGREITDGTDAGDSCSLIFTSQDVIAITSWNGADCDGDGVTNGQEVIDGTDPTDMCAFVAANVTLATQPIWNNSDCDGDGVKNGQEIIDGTDPNDSCSYNPIHISGTTSSTWNDADCDGDGVKNRQEMIDGTNPVDFCSFQPSHITTVTSSQWNQADCDGDGVSNSQEIVDGTNPKDACMFITVNQTLPASGNWNNSDCDGDGVVNGKEVLDGTDPLDLCSFVLSHQTVQVSQIWAQNDCDGDGVVNSRELADKTDPTDPCSLIAASQTVETTNFWNNLDCDGDGVINGQEVQDGTDLNDYCSSVSAHVTLELSQEFLNDDCDGDGINNEEEIGANPQVPYDFNENGTPDYLEFNNKSDSEDNLEIFKSLTPNGNGENDVFVIRNINLYPNNTVTVFNRWGVIVYQEDGYGSNEKFFRGYSDGKCTMRKGIELPNGTYFYQVRYNNNEGVEKSRTGYLFINK